MLWTASRHCRPPGGCANTATSCSSSRKATGSSTSAAARAARSRNSPRSAPPPPASTTTPRWSSSPATGIPSATSGWVTRTGLPFPDGCAAGYRTDKVLHDLADPRAALEDARRVLAPGGRIVVVDLDWDAIIIASDDPARTRAVVHARTDKLAAGFAARQAPELLRRGLHRRPHHGRPRGDHRAGAGRAVPRPASPATTPTGWTPSAPAPAAAISCSSSRCWSPRPPTRDGR